LLIIIATVGALVGLGFWLFAVLQPKDSAINPSGTQVSNTISSVKLVISDDSFKAVNGSKTLQVAIDTNDNSLISKVDYLLDGKVAGRSIEEPFVVTINLAQLAAGKHAVQAIAYDTKGGSVKSKTFTFTIEPDEIIPSDDASEDMIGAIPRKKVGVVTASANSGSQNSGDNSGNNPGDPGTPDNGTRTAGGWWASLPADMQICSNGSLDGGPTSASADAIIVPAGDNSGFSFNQVSKTFWFAPGVHTLGSGEFSSINPGSGSTYIGAPGAVLDGQNLNSYAFQGSASNVTIKYLEIRNFGVGGTDNMNEGVINHDSGTGWVMEYLNAHNNDGAAIFIGSENTVRHSCLKDNGQYGFSMFKSPISGDSAIKNIILDHNEISGNNQDDWENQPGQDGCGCTGAGKFWDVKGATVTNNYVHDNLSTGLWADTNDIDFLFDSNWIEHNNGEGIWYEISFNATISRNVLKRNAWATGQNNQGSPGPAIYISESGGDSRLQSSTSGSTNLQIKNNLIENNFSGVSIFENSNRFCNSRGNTSTGYCTPFVTPTNFSEQPVSGGSYPAPINDTHPCYVHIAEDPYTKDCRWHSQNVKVFNNEFRFDDSVVPCAGGFCGVQALFATGANNIPWAPDAYKVENVQADVLSNNHNKFYDNTYIGPWRFAKGDGTRVAFANWQSTYLQDTGSTYDAPPIANYIDSNTSTLEGGIGHWQDWFSTTVTQSTLQAHTGTHSLQIMLTGGGWADQLDNYPGIDTAPGNKRISFWAKQGTGSVPNMSMKVLWFNEAGSQLGTTVDVPLTLSSGWQQGSIDANAPAGTVKAYIRLSGSSGSAGNTVFVDDLVIGDAP
jgi:hypothetical protein